MELIVIEKNGRQKTFQVEKGVTRVGSSAVCDVKLSSAEVQPLHLQIFYSLRQPDRCKVLNIGSEISVNIQGNRQRLLSSASLEMTGGDEILIDTYKLLFRLPILSGIIRTSNFIDAALSFPTPVLYAEIPTIGTLTVCNTGKNPSCQFQVRVGGLPGDCFRLDPVPMMYPDVPEQFLVYIFHQKRYPKAGFHEIKLTISEINAYPGEEVILRQQIYVMPVFETTLELQDDMPPREVVSEKPLGMTSSMPNRESSASAVAPSLSSSPNQPDSATSQQVRKLQQGAPEDYWTETGVNIASEKNTTA